MLKAVFKDRSGQVLDTYEDNDIIHSFASLNAKSVLDLALDEFKVIYWSTQDPRAKKTLDEWESAEIDDDFGHSIVSRKEARDKYRLNLAY